MAALQDPVEWTYSGLAFARAHLADKVDWVAAYGQSEPADAHTLWQFTDKQNFAGIGTPCDGSVFNGTIDQLIALTQGAVTDMTPDQAAQLTQIQTFLTGLDFAFNNGAPTPYSVRGEITARLRAIDGHTANPPAALTLTAANIDAISTAVAAKVVAGASAAQVATAVRAELAANPLH
jgi:hypothetical protein